MNAKYSYPDPGDAITIKVISEYEAFKNYWAKSERRVLDNIHNTIHKIGLDNYSLLDVGCGEGRLFTDFINGASKIVGIEPDTARYANAQSCVNDNGFQNKVLLLNASLESAHLHEEFDIVLSSHIIQHIPSYAVESHLRRLGDLTKDGGLLIINTNVSNKSDEYFIKGAIKEDKAEEVEIGADEFNRLTQCVGELPVHMFDRDTICNLMCSMGFELVSMSVFHVEREVQERYGEDVDRIVNSDPLLVRQYGRDINFIFRKHDQVKSIERGALAEFCAFNVPLYGIGHKELCEILASFRQANSSIFRTDRFCLDSFNVDNAKELTGKEIACDECVCGETADKFCSTGHIINSSYRYYVGTTYFKFADSVLPLKVSVTFFPYRNIGIICFNIVINDLTVDDVIALKQYVNNYSCDKRHKNWRGRGVIHRERKEDENIEYIGAGDYFASSEEEATKLPNIDGKYFWFVCNNLIKDISLALGNKGRKKFLLSEWGAYTSAEKEELEVIIDNFSHLYVSRFIYPTLEINSTNFNKAIDDANVWGVRHCRSLYGLLVGDEGYKYVPKSLAHKRITEHHWGTRNFVNIFAYSSNIIMLNFKSSSDIGKAYMNRQMQWSDSYYDKSRNLYFKMNPCIAGVDHGLFRIVERNIVVYFENEYISKFDQSNAININKKRNKILLFIYKTATSLDEINDLFNVISQASGTASAINSIKHRLALRSEEKTLINQKLNNDTILILTIASIVLGILAIGSNSNAYNFIMHTSTTTLDEYKLWAHLLFGSLCLMVVAGALMVVPWRRLVNWMKYAYYKRVQKRSKRVK